MLIRLVDDTDNKRKTSLVHVQTNNDYLQVFWNGNDAVLDVTIDFMDCLNLLISKLLKLRLVCV